MSNKNIKLSNFSRYLEVNLKGDHSLIDVLNDITQSIKDISKVISDGDINNILGNLETQNVQGETQKKLDVFTLNMQGNTLLIANGIPPMKR